MTKSKLTQAINWNRIIDPVDRATWDKLIEQFWVSSRVPVSNDMGDWDKLSAPEKDLYNKVFGGLTLLDTLQGEVGNNEIAKDSLLNIAIFRWMIAISAAKAQRNFIDKKRRIARLSLFESLTATCLLLFQ